MTQRVLYSDDKLEQCIDSFFSFYEALKDNNKEKKHVDMLENDLLLKLEWWQLKSSLDKQCELTLDADIEIYKNQLVSLQNEKKMILNDIEALKRTLNDAKLQKNNQEQYNIMINEINKEPPRHETNKKLNEMQVKLQSINAELSKCTKTIQRRSKQCYAAFAAVQALNRSMMQRDDGVDEEDEDDDVDMD